MLFCHIICKNKLIGRDKLILANICKNMLIYVIMFFLVIFVKNKLIASSLGADTISLTILSASWYDGLVLNFNL